MRCHFDVRKIAINTFHVNSPKTCLEMFQRMMWVFETIEEEILKNSLTRLEFLKGLLHKEIELSYAGLVGRGLRFSFLKSHLSLQETTATTEHSTSSTSAEPKSELLASAGIAGYVVAAGIGFLLGNLFFATACYVARRNNKTMCPTYSPKNLSFALHGLEESAERFSEDNIKFLGSKKVDDDCTIVKGNVTPNSDGLTEQPYAKHEEKIDDVERFGIETNTSKPFFVQETNFNDES